MDPVQLLIELKAVWQKAKDAADPAGPGGAAWTAKETLQFAEAALRATADGLGIVATMFPAT